MDDVRPQLPRDLLDLIAEGPPNAAVDAIKRRYGIPMPTAMKIVNNVIAGLAANDLGRPDDAWLINWIGPLPPDFKSRHLRGLPPRLTGGIDHRIRDSPPILLVLVLSGPEATIYRYSADGRPAGSSLHQSKQDAIDRATSEYASALAEWVQLADVPKEQPHRYARRLILARMVG